MDREYTNMPFDDVVAQHLDARYHVEKLQEYLQKLDALQAQIDTLDELLSAYPTHDYSRTDREYASHELLMNERQDLSDQELAVCFEAATKFRELATNEYGVPEYNRGHMEQVLARYERILAETSEAIGSQPIDPNKVYEWNGNEYAVQQLESAEQKSTQQLPDAAKAIEELEIQRSELIRQQTQLCSALHNLRVIQGELSEMTYKENSGLVSVDIEKRARLEQERRAITSELLKEYHFRSLDRIEQAIRNNERIILKLDEKIDKLNEQSQPHVAEPIRGYTPSVDIEELYRQEALRQQQLGEQRNDTYNMDM